jgi:hypothetical protein
MRLLLDVNVPRFAAQSTGRIIGEKTTAWGGQVRKLKIVDHGPLYPNVGRFLRENIPYIPALAFDGKNKGIEFCTYEILNFERWKIPPAIDWAGCDVTALFELRELPFEIHGGCVIADGQKGTFDRFLRFLEEQFDDNLLRELKLQFKPSQSRDCCHVFLAHCSNFDGFVTLDGDFIGPFNQIANSFGLGLRCYSPKEICIRNRICPIDDQWFARRAESHITYEPA